MQKTYCTSCGSKVEYSLQKPKFCSSCGEPLDIVNVAKNVTRQGSVASQRQETSGEETNYSHVPKVKGLQYEVEYDSSAMLRKITPEDLRDNAAQRTRR